MLKKILSLGLAVMILTIASGVNVAAQSSRVIENQVAVKQENADGARDLKSLVKAQTNSDGLNISSKNLKRFTDGNIILLMLIFPYHVDY